MTPGTLTREDLLERRKAHERERLIASVIGFLPLLVIYGLTHTRILRQLMPESKSQALVVLLLIPGAWFAAVMLLHGRLGPFGRRAKCSQCQAPLVGKALQDAIASGQCGQCGAPIEARSSSAG
jgi:hypothetical protein